MCCIMCSNKKLDCYIQCDQCKKEYCMNDIEICENSDAIPKKQPTIDTIIQIHMILCKNCVGRCDICNMKEFIKINKKLPYEVLSIINNYLF